MADESKNEAPPTAVDELIRVTSFIDDEGDVLVVVKIGGVVFGTMAPTREAGLEIAKHTLATLLRFQSQTSVTMIDHAGTILTGKHSEGN